MNENEEQDLTQDFLSEVQAREFINWRNNLKDEVTIGWIDLLIEECQNLDEQVEDLEKELEAKQFFVNYFFYSVLFLFLFFGISVLKCLLFN